MIYTIWATATGQVLRTIETEDPESAVNNVNNAESLCVGDYDNGYTVFDVNTGLPKEEFVPLIEEQVRINITRKRDELTSAGIDFAGKRMQTRPEDRENIAGASTMALGAMIQGAQSGDYRWADPDHDFEWIAEDNSVIKLDAQTMFAFGSAVAAMKSKYITIASAMKKIEPLPQNYEDPSWWQ